jgi:hypothetical protein
MKLTLKKKKLKNLSSSILTIPENMTNKVAGGTARGIPETFGNDCGCIPTPQAPQDS